MYSVIVILFFVACGMMLAGVLGRAGTGSVSEADSNVAASLGILVVFALMLLNYTSFSELTGMFEAICGGIPYIDDIADYGSLKEVFTSNPLKAAESFLDVVFLSTTINLLSLLPHTQGNVRGKMMVKLLTGIVLALISLAILNYIIKTSGPYQYMISLLGALIAIISVGSIPITIISLMKKNSISGIGFIAMLLIFSKSKVVGILRDSFLKAVVYTWGIYILEERFGTLANSMSILSRIVIAFVPVIVVCIGVAIILISTLKNK